MNDNSAKNGTATRVQGLACDNEKCARYHHIVMFGFHCSFCGSPLVRASAAVACFQFEHDQLITGEQS